LDLYEDHKCLIFYDANHIAGFLGEAFELLHIKHLIYTGDIPVDRRAYWTCVAEGSKEGTESPSPGCGLRLYNVCNFTLIEIFEGNLQKIIDGMDSGEEFFPLGLRADAEFYKADGLLMRHLTRG